VAAPTAAFIQLPLDTGNLGKKVRTQTRVVGADTVHEHFFIPISARSRTGVYFFHSGVLTIPTGAHNGTTSGHWWYVNPAGSTIKAAIRRAREVIQFTVTTAVDVSVPRTAFALVTFTGSPSGATINPAKRDSTDAAAQATMRTANTGMTVTLGNLLRAVLPPIIPTASSGTIQANMPAQVGTPWDLDEDEMPVLRTGEGVVCYSPDAATTANRRLITDVIAEEFE
jgi:hypothetical protein